MNSLLDSYEAIDPEPPLRFETGSMVHYWWPDVVAHIAWHARMCAWYRRMVK